MNLALDHDGTFTADPELWAQFCRLAQARGHKVYLVTMRFPEEGIDDRASKVVDAVIYTSRDAKKAYVDKINLGIDIWIDDSPFWIYQRGAA